MQAVWEGGRLRLMSQMKQMYKDDIIPALTKRFGYSSPMEAPKVEKVVINMGVNEAIEDAKALEGAVKDLSAITGQKPVVTKAKKSVAAFKLRKGMAIGCKVTLRGEKMFDFMTKLFNVALPRIRDFAGVSRNAFDGRGNYTLGLREQIIFPEIDYDSVDRIRGMEITIVTTAKTDEEAAELLQSMGVPFKNE